MANARTEIDRFLYRIDVSPTVFTPKEARAEYARLRKIANKRIQRLQASEYAGSDAALTGAFPALPAPLKGKDAGKDDKLIYRSLQDVAFFVSKKTSTIQGIREAEKKALKTLHEHGYDFVTKKNIREFGEFWREVKTHSDAKKYDSETIVQMFKDAKQKRIDPVDLARDFDFWIQNSEKIDTIKRSTETMTSEQARAKLERSEASKASRRRR